VPPASDVADRAAGLLTDAPCVTVISVCPAPQVTAAAVLIRTPLLRSVFPDASVTMIVNPTGVIVTPLALAVALADMVIVPATLSKLRTVAFAGMPVPVTGVPTPMFAKLDDGGHRSGCRTSVVAVNVAPLVRVTATCCVFANEPGVADAT
jgi:hypothetical protein